MAKVDASQFKSLEKSFKKLSQEEKQAKFVEWGRQGGQQRAANYHNNLSAQKISKQANTFINASVNWAVKKVMTRIQTDIKNKYNDEVRRFYADYEPNSYSRTYSLFSAYKPVYYKHGDTHYIGAEISGENIPYTPYHSIYDSSKPMDPLYVFNLFYYSGSHGNSIHFVSGDNITTIYDAKYTTPDAHEEMHKWWESYKIQAQLMFNEELRKAFTHNKSLLKG